MNHGVHDIVKINAFDAVEHSYDDYCYQNDYPAKNYAIKFYERRKIILHHREALR